MLSDRDVGDHCFFTPLFSPLPSMSASKCIENNIKVLKTPFRVVASPGCIVPLLFYHCAKNMSKYSFFCSFISKSLHFCAKGVKNLLLTDPALRANKYAIQKMSPLIFGGIQPPLLILQNRSVKQTSTKVAGQRCAFRCHHFYSNIDMKPGDKNTSLFLLSSGWWKQPWTTMITSTLLLRFKINSILTFTPTSTSHVMWNQITEENCLLKAISWDP